jgi:hypothetical protein
MFEKLRMISLEIAQISKMDEFLAWQWNSRAGHTDKSLFKQPLVGQVRTH